MPIALEAIPLITHAAFLVQGTAFTLPEPGTVRDTAKPGDEDPIWDSSSLGDLEEYSFNPESETFEKKGGRPGVLVTTDVIELSRSLKIEWTTTDITPLVPQLIFGTATLTGASSTGIPLAGPLNVKGWLRFKAYSGATAKHAGDLWVSLKVTKPDPWSGKNIVRAKFEAITIHNPLNTLKFG